MSKAHVIAAASVAVFLRWVAVGHVTATAAGVTVSVPALLVAAVTVVTITAAAAALLVYRVRAERAMAAAWKARRAAP